MEDNNTTAYSFSATKIDSVVTGNSFRYMAYGDEDTFPDEMVELYKNSSLHHTMVESIAQLIAGEGLYSDDEDFDYSYFTSNLGEDLEEIFASASKELKLHGYAYIEVIKKRESMILNVIPAQYVRNAQHGMLESPKSFFVNTNPDQGRNFDAEIHAFDGRRRQSMLYIKRPDTTTRSYASPDYLGAVNDILTDYKAKRHKLNSIENGFMPSVIMTMEQGNKTKEEKRIIEKRVIDKYSGSESENRVMVVWKQGEQKPVEMETFEPGNVVEFFKELGPEVTESILLGHRANSPALFGLFLNITSGLGNNADELIMAYSIFLETVVKPYQKILLKGFTKILDFAGQDVELSVSQLNPGIMEESEKTESTTETQDEGTEVEEEVQVEEKTVLQKITNKLLGK